jgi:hypothetical protein
LRWIPGPPLSTCCYFLNTKIHVELCPCWVDCSLLCRPTSLLPLQSPYSEFYTNFISRWLQIGRGFKRSSISVITSAPPTTWRCLFGLVKNPGNLFESCQLQQHFFLCPDPIAKHMIWCTTILKCRVSFAVFFPNLELLTNRCVICVSTLYSATSGGG